MKLSRQLLIVMPPALLAILELFHPFGHHDTIFASLKPQIGRWMLVHYLQLVLFPMTAFSVYQLTSNQRGWHAKATAIALAIYGVGYTAYDSIAGIGTGILISDAIEVSELLGEDVPADFNPIMNETIQAFYHSPLSEIIAIVAVVAAIVGFLLTAIKLHQRGHGLFPVVMLAGACWGVTKTHSPPYGPITFAFIATALAYVVFASPKRDDVFLERSASDDK